MPPCGRHNSANGPSRRDQKRANPYAWGPRRCASCGKREGLTPWRQNPGRLGAPHFPQMGVAQAGSEWTFREALLEGVVFDSAQRSTTYHIYLWNRGCSPGSTRFWKVSGPWGWPHENVVADPLAKPLIFGHFARADMACSFTTVFQLRAVPASTPVARSTAFAWNFVSAAPSGRCR